MSCVVHSTGSQKCERRESLVTIPQDMQMSLLYQDLAERKTHFHSHYIFNAIQDVKWKF